MNIKHFFRENPEHKPTFGAREILKYIGPGLLVTVGFIDPGNWASNIAAGSQYGYTLLWMVTLSTIMLIILQHNVAHLGIVTGDCLAEAAMKNLRPNLARVLLGTGILAVISTALAEILGAEQFLSADDLRAFSRGLFHPLQSSFEVCFGIGAATGLHQSNFDFRRFLRSFHY